MSRPVRLPGTPRYAGDRYGRTGDPAKLAQKATGKRKVSPWATMTACLEEPVECVGECHRLTRYVVQLHRPPEDPVGPLCPKCARARKGSALPDGFEAHAKADRT